MDYFLAFEFRFVCVCVIKHNLGIEEHVVEEGGIRRSWCVGAVSLWCPVQLMWSADQLSTVTCKDQITGTEYVTWTNPVMCINIHL